MPNSSHSRNVSMDVWRALAAYSVVVIHFGFTFFGIYANALARFAVPFFFMISGYYARGGKYLNKVKKLLWMYICSEVTYFIAYLWLGQIDLYPVNLQKICEMLVYNSPLFYGVSWFLLAMIYTYLGMLLVKKWRFRKMLYWLIPILIIWQWAWGRFQTLSGISLSYLDFKVLRAIPFFGIGYWFKAREERIKNIAGDNLLKLCMIFGIMLTLAERWVLNQYTTDLYSLYLGNCIFVVSLFVYVCKHPIVNMPFLSYVGKELSMHIYILHVLVVNVMDRLFGRRYDIVWILGGVTLVAYLCVWVKRKAQELRGRKRWKNIGQRL